MLISRGNTRRHQCSSCGKGWFAVCWDTGRTRKCSVCQANQSVWRQAAAQRAQQSRVAIAAANAPVYSPSQPAQPPTAPLRKAIYHMDETELEQWTQHIESALSDMQQRNEAYTERRAACGIVTVTDVSLQRDNRVAEDVKQALQELIILWRMAHSGGSVGSSSPPTGMLIDYDTTGKVKP